MKWEDIEREFEVDIPESEPVFPANIVCSLLDIQYYLLHEIVKEGMLEAARRQQEKEEKRRAKKASQAKKGKRLFSYDDMKLINYIKHLIEDKGVNINGVKVILEIDEG